MYNQSAIIEEILRQQQEAQNSPYDNVRKLTGRISKTGKNMTAVGDYMKNELSNPTLQKLGSNISSAGSKLSNGANTVNNVIAPQNYFKGFAPKPFAALNPSGEVAGIGTVGATDTATQAAAGGLAAVPTAQTSGAVGSAIGSEIAGTGSTLGGSAVGNAIGAEVGGTAAGSTAGGAAGGAAAGAGSAAAATGIGALVALGVMAAMGTHRKQAKKSGQALLSAMNKESDAALEQTNEFAKNMQNQTQDYSQPMLPTSYNGVTGGAAPVQQLSPIEDYQNTLRAQGYDESVINGIPQGLNGGHKEIDDWIKQYNSGAGRNNPINIPQTEEEIAAAKAGNFNAPVQVGNAEETLKQGILDKFLSGIGDLASGYQENRNTAFAPENLQRDKTKSKMNHIGEALGTTARIAQKPLVQGLVAGGLSAALTGNPLYGLGQGYKFANNRAMSNVYGDILKQYGVNVPDSGTFGNVSSSDMRNIGNMAETHAWHEYMNKRYADELAAKIAKNEADKKYKEDRIEVMQQNANTNAYKAKNGTKVTHVSTGGGRTTGSTGGTSKGGNAVVKMEAPNGKVYLVPESQVSRYKKLGGKIVG